MIVVNLKTFVEGIGDGGLIGIWEVIVDKLDCQG
jgi:hypothetical protein